MRRALGATTRDILRLVVGHEVRAIAAGAVIGLAVSAYPLHEPRPSSRGWVMPGC